MDCNGNCLSCNSCNTLTDVAELFKNNLPDNLQIFKYNYDFYSKPHVLILGVTAECNLRCDYCFCDWHKEDMSLETAIKAADMALENFYYKKEHNIPCIPEKPEILFFGGEPLLKYEEIIKPIIIKYSDLFNYSITTNGLLLSEDIVDFLNQHNVSVLFSFDGIPEVQNMQRKLKNGQNSFELILKNIPYFLLKNKDTQMRMTLTRQSIPFLYDCYLFAEEMGFDKFLLAPNSFEKWTEQDFIECVKQMKKIGCHIYNELQDPSIINICGFYPFEKCYEIMWNIRLNKETFDNSIFRCGLGTLTFSVCPDGTIVSCQEEITHPIHIIGTVEEGINKDQHYQLLQTYFNNIQKARCETPCGVESYKICQSCICPSRMWENNFQIFQTDCYYNQAVYIAFRNLFILTRDSLNPKIRNFTGEPDWATYNSEKKE